MFGLVRRLFFLAILVTAFMYAYPEYISPFLAKKNPKAKKQVDNVLGTATKFVNKQTSQSASLVDKIVFKQATKPIIEQYNKLPEEKKKEIKNQICK